MLRFRLGRIPVEVHLSHLVIAAIIAWSFVPATAGWPPSGLAMGQLLAAMVVVFFSILFHELGHALVSLAFGYQPAVQLAWLGGNTRPNAPGPIPWQKDLLLTLAGPVFGLALGGASLLTLHQLFSFPLDPLALFSLQPGVQAGVLAFVVYVSAWVNVSWSVLNLVPVVPLDGGRISLLVLMRVLGRTGFTVAQAVGTVVSFGLAYLMMRIGQEPAALLFAFFGAQAFGQLLQALRRPGLDPNDPSVQTLKRISSEFQAGRVDVARSLGEALLDQKPEITPRIRSHVHHMLGWIALKEGHGRRALDHFSQVGAVPAVEPQAAAAAYSLIGDDGRALPLWEHAFRLTGDRTVLHEWAGTLLRLGRSEDASRLPQVDLPAAWECAERVFFLRERYSEAAEAAQKRVELRPSPEAAYDAACAYARAGNRERAVQWLERARSLGFADLDYASKDPDLASLHGHPAFERWRTEVSPAP